MSRTNNNPSTSAPVVANGKESIITKVCKYCSNEFNTYRGKQEFCSKSCSIKARYDDDIGIFNNPDITEADKMYLLGLIITDGCISLHKKKWYITIGTNNIEFAQKTKEKVCPQRKLYYSQPRGYEAYQITWKNDNDVSVLNSYGIYPRKSLTKKFPCIPDEYIGCFLRGVFDGDGCIYFDNVKWQNQIYRYKNISITSGSYDFAVGLKKALEKCGLHPRLNTDCRKRPHETYYVKLHKQKEINTFFDLIYHNEVSLMLERKYVLFN